MKKVVVLFSVLIILAIICVAVLFLCNCLQAPHPSDKAGIWISEDPNITLNYSQSESGRWEPSEVLIWQDKTIDISIAFGQGMYCAYPATDLTCHEYEERLFSGSWKYRKGNLVLFIEEDFTFNEQYSQIVFSPVRQTNY